MTLVEPLRQLFKDEVRAVGAELGLDEEFVVRQPFPGPGLAVRILGEVTAGGCDLLRQADVIVRGGDQTGRLVRASCGRASRCCCRCRASASWATSGPTSTLVAIRAVESRDGMTADWARLPHDLLARISSRIVNEVRGINRVVYDISSKPTVDDRVGVSGAD